MSSRMTTTDSWIALLAARYEDRFPALSPRAKVVQSLRVLELEIRRSPAVIAALVIAIVTAWVMWEALPKGVVRWSEVSWSAGDAMVPVSAIGAGIAAFAAGRDHQRRMLDQVTTTIFRSLLRDLFRFLSVVMWCVTGYLAVVVGFFAHAHRYATWGSADLDATVVTVATLVVSCAIGWLLGTIFPRLIMPVMTVVLVWGAHMVYPLTQDFRDRGLMDRWSTIPEEALYGPNGEQLYVRVRNDAFSQLIPYEMLEAARPHVDRGLIVPLGVLWLASLAVVLWCAAYWWRNRGVGSTALLAISVLGAGTAGAASLNDYTGLSRMVTNPIPVECTTRIEGQLRVCMERDDIVLLSESADTISALLKPIAGRTLVPMIWANAGGSESGGVTVDGAHFFYVVDSEAIEEMELHRTVLRSLLVGQQQLWFAGITEGDYVVLTWLLHEAGIPREEAVAHDVIPHLPVIQTVETPDAPKTYADAAEVDAAIERFLSLPDDEREAWLDAHWADVFMGTLTLDDLP